MFTLLSAGFYSWAECRILTTNSSGPTSQIDARGAGVVAQPVRSEPRSNSAAGSAAAF
jgi:hypothetical protein